MGPTGLLVLVLLLVATLGAVLQHLAPEPIPREDAAQRPSVTARRPAGMRALRNVYHFRGLLVSPPLILAAFVFTHETEADHFVWPAGVALVALGVGLRVWAQTHIRFRLKERRQLTTTGPYALCRNPLYIANTLICAGATVASELLWLVPITVVWCSAIYSLVVRQEEGRLLRKYGQPYGDYLAAVPRWVPRTLQFRSLGMARGQIGAALLVELPCVFVLLPFIVKEVVSPWYGH